MTKRQLEKQLKNLRAENVNTELKIVDCIKVKHRLNTWQLWRQEKNNVSEYYFIGNNGQKNKLYYLSEEIEDIYGLADKGKLTVQIYKGTNIIKKFIAGNENRYKNSYNYILTYAALTHIKDALAFYLLSFLLFVINYGFDSITGKTIMIILSLITFGFATFYFVDKILIYFNIKKQMNRIDNYNDTVSGNVTIVRIKTRYLSPLGQGRSNCLDEYLKICYIKDLNENTKKYYHIMASSTAATPQKSCECYVTIYKNTNIIKGFISW